jgi:hypothetical protein
MLMWGVGLNRTSLAAFIIAMGMLVEFYLEQLIASEQ